MANPEIIIIAALAESNRVIGKNGKLPWRIPEDSARFQAVTLGHTVIMGRKTWEHDVEQCPLKQRHNIVVSRSSNARAVSPRCPNYPFELSWANSLNDALSNVKAEEKKIFIVGGATLYQEALAIADTLDLTLIEGEFEGDTFFPEYSELLGDEFKLAQRETHPGYRFDTYRRTKAASRQPAAIPELQKVG